MAKSKKQSTKKVKNSDVQVNQAGGNVTTNEKSSKTVGEKIKMRVGIVASVATIIATICSHH